MKKVIALTTILLSIVLSGCSGRDSGSIDYSEIENLSSKCNNNGGKIESFTYVRIIDHDNNNVFVDSITCINGATFRIPHEVLESRLKNDE